MPDSSWQRSDRDICAHVQLTCVCRIDPRHSRLDEQTFYVGEYVITDVCIRVFVVEIADLQIDGGDGVPDVLRPSFVNKALMYVGHDRHREVRSRNEAMYVRRNGVGEEADAGDADKLYV